MTDKNKDQSVQFESQLDDITIKLQSFEGPLDLLVHLIKENQLNVYDIPIALVTRQYLDYLDLMQELNLDVASEFLVMAATLIHIKSRTLLPRPGPSLLDDDEADPRDALVQRLLEHQKFKTAAGMLHDREMLRSAQWTRPDSRIEAVVGDEYEPELEVDLFGLMAAFKLVLERARERPPIPLPPEQISIEARIDQLLERLSETEACGFDDLFQDVASRGDMIVTFLALLEMIRLKLVRVFQAGHTGPIRIYKRARPKDAPHPIHDPEDEYKAHHPQASARRKVRRHDRTEAGDGRIETRLETAQLKAIVEALVYASPEPLTLKMLFKLLNDEPKEDVLAALNALQQEYAERGGLHLAEVAGGYQITTRPEFHEWVRRLFHERTSQKLSVASLETLAVIAYKQPITAAEIGEIRGVNTSGVLSTLMERRLIKIVGRKNVIGRPFLYGTTKEFLIRFGFRDLERSTESGGHGRGAGLRCAVNPHRASRE